MYNVTNVTKGSKSDIQIWHKRIGHLNAHDLQLMVKNNFVRGVMISSSGSLPACTTCIQGKLTSLPFQRRVDRSDHPLQLVYSNICGPIRTQSNGSGVYFATFIDDYSR